MLRLGAPQRARELPNNAFARDALVALSTLHAHPIRLELRTGFTHALSLAFTHVRANSWREFQPAAFHLDVAVNGAWRLEAEVAPVYAQLDMGDVELDAVVDLQALAPGATATVDLRVRAIGLDQTTATSTASPAFRAHWGRVLTLAARAALDLFPDDVRAQPALTDATTFLAPLVASPATAAEFAPNQPDGAYFDYGATGPATLNPSVVVPQPPQNITPGTPYLLDTFSTLTDDDLAYMFLDPAHPHTVALTPNHGSIPYVDVPVLVRTAPDDAFPQPYEYADGPNTVQVFARVFAIAHAPAAADAISALEMARRLNAMRLRGDNATVFVRTTETNAHEFVLRPGMPLSPELYAQLRQDIQDVLQETASAPGTTAAALSAGLASGTLATN